MNTTSLSHGTPLMRRHRFDSTRTINNSLVPYGSIYSVLIVAAFSSQAWAVEISVNDPATDAGYTVSSYVGNSTLIPDIGIIGVYETRGDHGGGFHPQGTANVHVQYDGPRPMIPLVLVLSSYEPTLDLKQPSDGTHQ